MQDTHNDAVTPVEARGRFAGSGEPQAGEAGRFEILAMTAGSGNGWVFPESALRESLPLWEGVETFVDHAGWREGGGRSLRDLAGICSAPAYDEAARGIRLSLRATGPSGALLEAIGRDWLAGPEPRPRVGFSADVVFTAQGRQVRQILRVLSLDVVFNPARGGQFLRALNQQLEEDAMSQNENETTEVPAPVAESAPQDLSALRALRAEMSACLLESTLAGARLPLPLAEHVRKQFSGKACEAQALQAAIEEARGLAASLQGGAAVVGPGRVDGLLTSEERLQAAVDDLLGAPRDPAMQGKPVERLAGLRELYVGLTGDVDLHGGYYRQRAQFATTATMPALVKNALNKIVAQQWDELGRAGYRWWEPVVMVEHFTRLQQITGILVGDISTLPDVGEGEPYEALAVADSEEVGDWNKYGGYLPLTLELIDRDEVTRLRTYPRKLANASLRTISRLVASVFTETNGVGPEMKDHLNVFETNVHRNLGSAALSPEAWEATCAGVYGQKLLTGGANAPMLGIDPRYLLVPRSLRLAAMRILYPSWEREANIVSENMQKGQAGDVITVPDWTDEDNWAAVCDPRLAPAIYVGERFGLKPEIFIAGDEQSPAMFTNDETRLKIRHFLSVFVADYRPMYKQNVVG